MELEAFDFAVPGIIKIRQLWLVTRVGQKLEGCVGKAYASEHAALDACTGWPEMVVRLLLSDSAGDDRG